MYARTWFPRAVTESLGQYRRSRNPAVAPPFKMPRMEAEEEAEDEEEEDDDPDEYLRYWENSSDNESDKEQTADSAENAEHDDRSAFNLFGWTVY